MPLSRKEVILLAVAFLLTRLLLAAVGLLSMAQFASTTGSEYRHLQAVPVVDMWYRWDAGFYVAIARYGYGWASSGHISADTVFLPLYPLTIHSLDLATGCSTAECATVSGLLISNGALLIATLLLYMFTKTYAGAAAAWRTAWLLLLGPGGVYLSGVYAEGLFLCLSVLTFVLLLKDQFYWAAIMAGLAAITRPMAVALCLSLLFYLWQKKGARSWGRTLSAALPLLTFGTYTLIAGITAHDPLAYFSVYHLLWDRQIVTSPIQTFVAYFSRDPVSLWGWRLSWIDPFFAVFYLTLALLVLRRDRLLGVFSVLSIAVPVGSGNLLGIPRYGIVVFPFYLLIGRWATTWWKQVMVYTVSISLMLFFTARFVLWRWLA